MPASKEESNVGNIGCTFWEEFSAHHYRSLREVLTAVWGCVHKAASNAARFEIGTTAFS